ncbi:MAG: hypothetical protein UZ08_BCD001001305 [Candidatus Parvibacillus calidus]|nr:MAG: hypothetical protein UZ08_BCD001001305 [Candidatus Parvibacillus calidus]
MQKEEINFGTIYNQGYCTTHIHQATHHQDVGEEVWYPAAQKVGK